MLLIPVKEIFCVLWRIFWKWYLLVIHAWRRFSYVGYRKITIVTIEPKIEKKYEMETVNAEKVKPRGSLPRPAYKRNEQNRKIITKRRLQKIWPRLHAHIARSSVLWTSRLNSRHIITYQAKLAILNSLVLVGVEGGLRVERKVKDCVYIYITLDWFPIAAEGDYRLYATRVCDFLYSSQALGPEPQEIKIFSLFCWLKPRGRPRSVSTRSRSNSTKLIPKFRRDKKGKTLILGEKCRMWKVRAGSSHIARITFYRC